MSDDWSARHFRVQEEMDAPDIDAYRLAGALRFIRRTNRWLGYTRATIRHLDSVTRDWPAGKPLTILDVATGSADVPEAALAWARARRIDLRLIGLDLHETTLTQARETTRNAVPLVRADALALPFADASVDVVMTSMFLHHLPDEQVVRALAEMRRVASHAVIAADLIRDRRALFWITLFTLVSDPLVRHDARVSVRQAFTTDEFASLCRRAGWSGVSVHRHFAHRLVAVDERR